MKTKLKKVVSSTRRFIRHASKRKSLIIWGRSATLLVISSALLYQNVHALNALHSAQHLDRQGDYANAQQLLKSAGGIGVLPNITHEVHSEQTRVAQGLADQAKLKQVKELLREHKTAEALKLLKSVKTLSGSSGNTSQAKQVAALQQALKKQSDSSGSSSQNPGTLGTTSGGSSGSSGGNIGSNNSGSSGSMSPPAFNGNLSSCPGTITQSGSYILTTNLIQTTPSTSCISISGLSGVAVDCAGHSITVNAGPVPINFYSATNYTIKNCHLSLPIGILNSSGGTVTGNTFTFSSGSGQAINLGGDTNNTISNNTITNGLLVLKAGSSANILNLNTINADPTVSAAGISGVIEVDDSNNNTFTNNNLDGGFHGSLGQQGPGADDGIMLKSNSGSTVSNNTMQNFFDCGIETIAQASNEQILNNTISNAAYCGIGSFYWSSWLNNTVQNNRVSGAKLLFQVFVDTNYPLSAGEQPSTIYFQGNQFISNIFSSGTASNTNSANINYASQFLPAGVTAITGNNKFQNNNFGKFDSGPNLQPQSAIVDLGGNICAAIPAGDPPSIVCN